MNKNLDNLFEQARKSIQSEMPLEEVQQLIHKQASSLFWTNQKIWIMSTSIIGIITICSLYFWTTTDKPNSQPVTTTSPSIELNKEVMPPIYLETVPKAAPDNLPLPLLAVQNTTTAAPTVALPKHRLQPSYLDSLGPKKNFTEYKLEIKKENSEQEIKKLKSELANYGIHMEIKELSYNKENKIKRFKGKFKTDSLFCGSSMNNYEFDISGSFKSMEFIFRVADNKNLKYLKIQSDNFEETIECFDDEIIATTHEAREMNKRIHAEMQRTHAEIAKAHQEMERTREEISRIRLHQGLNLREHLRQSKDSILSYPDWEKELENTIEHSLNNDQYTLESYPELDIIYLHKDLKNNLKTLEKELLKSRKELESRIIREIEVRTSKNGNHIRINGERLSLEQTEQELKKEAKALEKEAKALEKAAKKLRQQAKKKAKAAQKKSKQ